MHHPILNLGWMALERNEHGGRWFSRTVHTPLLLFGEPVCSSSFFFFFSFLLFGTTRAGMRVDEVEGLEACGASWKVAKVHGAPRNGPACLGRPLMRSRVNCDDEQ